MGYFTTKIMELSGLSLFVKKMSFSLIFLQIDWIGFLNCIHWMVFGTDLKIQRQNQNIIVLEQSFDSNISLILEPIFKQLLNLNANQKPDLDDHIMKLIDFIKSNIDKDAISLFNSFFLTNELNRL